MGYALVGVSMAELEDDHGQLCPPATSACGLLCPSICAEWPWLEKPGGNTTVFLTQPGS